MVLESHKNPISHPNYVTNEEARELVAALPMPPGPDGDADYALGGPAGVCAPVSPRSGPPAEPRPCGQEPPAGCAAHNY